MSKSSKRKNRHSSKRHSTVPAFLLKTFEILEDPTLQAWICWNKEGTAFIVKNVSKLAEEVLPRYFKHNNFASFVRQLNMYDFHKTRHEENENEFRHKFFRRGQKHLLPEIKRKATEIVVSSPKRLIPVNKNLELIKFKKEAQTFVQELSTLKSRQSELEKTVTTMHTQNDTLATENKLLWNKMTINKNKYETKIEKLMMFIGAVMHNPASIKDFADKRGLPSSVEALEKSDEMKQIETYESPEPEQETNFGTTSSTQNTHPLVRKRTRNSRYMENQDKIKIEETNFAGGASLDNKNSLKRPFQIGKTLDKYREVPSKQVKAEAFQNELCVPLNQIQQNIQNSDINQEQNTQFGQEPNTLWKNFDMGMIRTASTLSANKGTGMEVDFFSSPKQLFIPVKEEDVSTTNQDLFSSNFELENGGESFIKDPPEATSPSLFMNNNILAPFDEELQVRRSWSNSDKFLSENFGERTF